MIPSKTLERLSLYRRLLNIELAQGRTFMYSHDLAVLANITPTQVRRDLMSLKLVGNSRKGYEVSHLVSEIVEILGVETPQPMILIGVGNLGKAVLSYFANKKNSHHFVAIFDVTKDKVDKTIVGCPCYSMELLEKMIKQKKVKLAVLAVPAWEAQAIADRIVKSGVISIVNFAPTPIKVPDHVFVEAIDISVAIEKAAYFCQV